MTIKKEVVNTLLFLLLLFCFGCEEKLPYKIPKYPEIEQDIYFEGDYPPVVQITCEEDGQIYQVDAVEGQVMVMFEETVSHESAFEILKNNRAKIVAQLPKVHYYLVEVPTGKEGDFILCMRDLPEVDFAYPNIIEATCSVFRCVIDNFQIKEKKDLHGNMVVSMMGKGDGFHEPQKFDVALTDNLVNTNRVFDYLEEILENLESDDGAVINLSIGPRLIKFWSIIVPWQNRVLWNDRFVTEENKLSYKRKYINGLKNLIKFTKQYDAKDFVIVKSSGNEGMKELEIIVEQLRSELSPEEKKVFNRHFILVSAKDDNKEGDYPNDISLGRYDKMVTKVDISDMTAQDLNWQGTSFSSPRAAGFIANAAEKYDKKVLDVLAYARLATKTHPERLLTEEGLFEQIAKGDLPRDEEENSSPESADSGNKPTCGMGWYDYSATIPYSEELFRSKKKGCFRLPNGDAIKYQYVYECDFFPEYYMNFTMGNGGDITTKYSVALVKTMQDEKGYVGKDKDGYIDMRISFLGFDSGSGDNMIVLIRKK